MIRMGAAEYFQPAFSHNHHSEYCVNAYLASYSHCSYSGQVTTSSLIRVKHQLTHAEVSLRFRFGELGRVPISIHVRV